MDNEAAYFVEDLIGCKVVTTAGVELGELSDVMRTGANDVYVVWNGEKETLVPALKDVVIKVDLTERRIEVCLPEGLV